MLRINQNQHAAGAKNYYSAADYYSEGQELTGVWRGKGAAMLGLNGEISKDDWEALCDQQHPRTGEPLFQRRKSNRTIGYDFNFHVPKSVSALYALTEDERLLGAFQGAVQETMRDIEAEMLTRVRKAGKNEDRPTGNMLWGEFVHLTSRPVNGMPDPHLHAHCFVHNVTWDDKEQAWKAGQFRELKRDAPYFEALFHSRLASSLADLGLAIERKAKKDWELSGIPSSVVNKFSRRTAEIEEKAREKEIDDPEAKAELGAKTRSRKATQLTIPQLQAEWRNRLTAEEQDAISRVEKLIGSDTRPSDGSAAQRAVDHAIAHEFERRSVVPERVLQATALRQSVGQASAQGVLDAFARQNLLVHTRQGRQQATTREVLSEERRIIDFARQGRGTCRPLAAQDHPLKRDWLNASQQTAVRHIWESRDRVLVVRGAAGVGKTTLMQEVVKGIEAHGTKVLAFAPTAAASRNVLRRDGFADAETVARLLKDEALQRQAQGSVIWIDEAGLLGAKTMASVFSLADRLDARVLLTGDRRQHGSVERGAMLRLLEDEAGIKTAEVKEIQRQKDCYKKAIEALSAGRTGDGFARLDELGWIREVPDVERYRQLASDYVDTVARGKSALVVSPTHAEGERINLEIRRQLAERGLLGTDRRRFVKLDNAHLTAAERGDAVNFAPGDVLQFHQNAPGYQRGQRMAVNGRSLPLEYADRFALFHKSSLELAPGDLIRITQNGFTLDGQHRLNNGSMYRIKEFNDEGNLILENGWIVSKDLGHVAHGYVVTSHASQGKTVDHVFVGQNSRSGLASSREQFYVSCSRGRDAVTVYCDDKEALREAVSQSDDRMTAMELLNADRLREAVDLHRRYPEAALLPADDPRQQLEHERQREDLSHARQ